jgi:hypothetical protein
MLSFKATSSFFYLNNGPCIGIYKVHFCLNYTRNIDSVFSCLEILAFFCLAELLYTAEVCFSSCHNTRLNEKVSTLLLCLWKVLDSLMTVVSIELYEMKQGIWLHHFQFSPNNKGMWFVFYGQKVLKGLKFTYL